MDALFLFEILEREVLAIGILHDLLHFRLCHLQLGEGGPRSGG